MILSEVEVREMKTVGGVCSSTKAGNGRNGGKMENSNKNGGLPVGVRVWVQETFLCVLT